MVDAKFWTGRRVFLTGHTGFKGAWLGLWLKRLGAEVAGFALAPPTKPSLFELAEVASDVAHTHGDIRDFDAVKNAIQRHRPEIVIHMAAQSLVRLSYEDPVGTYATNLMGTVNLLEAARSSRDVRAILIVSSDKCYENVGLERGYRENDVLGGYDPYSSSKGCTELATSAYRRSFFSPERYGEHGVAVASARAGNVIGGGDWAADRLVPDAMRAFAAGKALDVRYPQARRPWQHVLNPLSGYLVLAENLVRHGPAYASEWNFGPAASDEVTVAGIASRLQALWGGGARWNTVNAPQPHEAAYLRLDCAKAQSCLGWAPRIGLEPALRMTVAWYKAHAAGAKIREITQEQIGQFMDCSASSAQLHAGTAG